MIDAAKELKTSPACKVSSEDNNMFRKAVISDLARISTIYDNIHDAEESGIMIIGWGREIYPVRKTAADAIHRGDMYVEESAESGIVATGIINQVQVPEYANCEWLIRRKIMM